MFRGWVFKRLVGRRPFTYTDLDGLIALRVRRTHIIRHRVRRMHDTLRAD